jgi:YD repeat-containing protein
MSRSEKELEKTEKSPSGEQKSLVAGDVGKADGADLFKHMMGGSKASDTLGRCEKRGDLAVDIDSKGEVTSVQTPSGTYRREADGKWNHISKEGIEEGPVFTNVKVEKDGTLSYDRGDRHYHRNPDGSAYAEEKDGPGRVYYDKNHRLVEAPAGDGHTRKFHYDENGKLDQIDGKLGHWDRTTGPDGKTQWVNRDNKEVWKGEFDMDPSTGDLWYTSHDGTSYTFTADGKDIRHKS